MNDRERNSPLNLEMYDPFTGTSWKERSQSSGKDRGRAFLLASSLTAAIGPGEC